MRWDAVRKDHKEVHDMCQDATITEVSMEEFDVVRSKVFYFQSVQSTIIAKLKSKPSQRTELCKYEIDTSSDDNLMPIRMFEALYI